MANVLIQVGSIGIGGNGNSKKLNLRYYVGPDLGQFETDVDLGWTVSAVGINAAIIDKVVADASANHGQTIGLLDSRILIGGAVGL